MGSSATSLGLSKDQPDPFKLNYAICQNEKTSAQLPGPYENTHLSATSIHWSKTKSR